MKTLLPEIDYAAGFRRFSAISVREAEGIGLVESAGAKAAHVVDPTLLVPREVYDKLGKYRKREKHTVCYFLGERIEDRLKKINGWAKRTGRHVTIISANGYMHPFPRTPGVLLKNLSKRFFDFLASSHVRIVSSCGPKEFYRAFSEADECLTDSFHAVMFSSICGCNLRFVRPADTWRKPMFARVEEFAQSFVSGSVFAEDLDSAMSSLDEDGRIEFDDAAISDARQRSAAWLRTAVSVC